MPQPSVGPVAAKKRPRSLKQVRSVLMPPLKFPSGGNPFVSTPASSLDVYVIHVGDIFGQQNVRLER